MSDILTINTEQDVIKETKVEPLPLYDDSFHMLSKSIPEYEDVLPNPLMTNLIKRLKYTMKKFGGIGLSANQCGVFERVFIIGHEDNSFACINPKVIEMSEELVKSKEGCLSYPGMYLTIPRHNWIIAEYTNELGQKIQQKLEGITARCYLHELDHMNGVKFVEHVGPVSIKMAKKKQQKLIRNYQKKFGKKESMFF
jgi:peptide deformylase